VSLEQTIQYLSALASPLVGAWLSNYIGLGGAQWVSAGLRMTGFPLLLLVKRKKPEERSTLPQLSDVDRTQMSSL
jgi:hypothetical protein